MTERKATTRGFERTSSLLQKRIRLASESRGFVETRLLTHWAEIVGQDIAAIARPINVSYGRHGMGASLTLLTSGAQAPVLEMQKEKLREKVNSTYGYNAISRIRITQTAPTGFADGRADFSHQSQKSQKSAPDPAAKTEAAQLAAPVSDTSLRSALEALGQNVLSKSKR